MHTTIIRPRHVFVGVTFPSVLDLAQHKRSNVCSDEMIQCRYCQNTVKRGPASTKAKDR